MTSLPPPSSPPSSFGRATVRLHRSGKQGQILVVALSRPRVKNAFNDDLYLDLVDCLKLAAADNSIAAIVLTGDGSYFSSGADLSSNMITEDDRDTLSLPTGKFMMELLRFPKLVCAAVQGPAVGIGVTLLMHCDLCWCSTSATFWAPFTRIALVPEFCSSVTFVETMGLSKANELLMMGKKIDAQTALEWNICSRVVSDASKNGDPFSNDSLASKMCNEIEARLLSLPLGNKTSEIFVSMIRQQKRAHLERVCREELVKLDERFNGGDVLEAVSQLDFGKKSSKL